MGGVCIYICSSLRGILKSFSVEPATVAAIVLTAILGGLNHDAMAATVTLSPGDNIQNAVNANPAGTTFILSAGAYRNQSVTSLQNGDSFIGQPGAIMDGATILTNWTQVSINGVEYWTSPGGTPLPTPSCGAGSECCMAGYEGCNYPQDLYVNMVTYQHVTSLANVVAGQSWYYDYTGSDGGIQNNIYLAGTETPNSDYIELGTQSFAFQGTASNITIENLTIEKYASPVQTGAIDIIGSDWLIQNNLVRLNHGEGITAHIGGDNIQVLGNSVTYNGELGIGAGGANNGVWDSNYITFNNVDGFNPNFEAGGSKFNGSNITIDNNIVHDNDGVGLFTDAGGMYNTYNGNISYNNTGGGIRYEISRYGTITNNTVYDNPDNPEIVYTGSDHGTISGNTVIDAGWGGIQVWNITGSRPNSSYPIYTVTDVQVTGNTIYIPSSAVESASVGLVDFATPLQPGIYTDPTNFFNDNIYEFPGSDRPCWHWGELSSPYVGISWSAWQADQQDLQGEEILNDLTLP
jgi:parallel beta-helix repeat protein